MKAESPTPWSAFCFGYALRKWTQPLLNSLLKYARLDPEAKLRAYTGPVLVLHAKDDTMVDASHATRNASYARRATLHLLPEGDHNSIFEDNREEYLAALSEFLKRTARRDS